MEEKDLKILGNYTTQPNNGFPLDCETLEYIQNNAALCEVLGNIAGDKVILYGCGLYNSNTMRQAGYVFLHTREKPKGEILYFAGGAVSSGMYVEKENMPVKANGTEYASAYTKRWLEAGRGTENYNWSDFVTVKTSRELTTLVEGIQKQLDTLTGVPVGTVLIWPGETSPGNYFICDGRPLKQKEYPVLYGVIGGIYNGGKYTASDEFRIPDMQNLFVAGKGNYDGQKDLGKIGGERDVTLTAEQSGLRAHTHEASVTGYRYNSGHENHRYRFKRGANEEPLPLSISVKTCAALPANESHENRPPYIVMNYIIKVK